MPDTPAALTRDQLAQAVLGLDPHEQTALFSDLRQRINPGRPGLRQMSANLPPERRPQLPAGTRIMSAAGLELGGREGVAEALAEAYNRRGGPDDGYVPVASIRVPLPEGRTLRRDAPEANSALVASITAQARRAHSREEATALVAAGGLCGPVAPYYEMFVVAADERPVRDSLPGLGAERGGVTLIPPPTLADASGAVTVVTAAQDAAGGPASEKACLHVTCPAARTYNVSAVARCLEFANFGARAWPEQVDGWLTLATAAHARRAETALLDGIAANSTAVTTTAAMGAGRDVLARVAQLAGGYRSRHRMRADARLSALLPAWAIDLMRADRARGLDEPREVTQADAEAWFAAAGVDVAWYVDGGTGKGQVFGAQAAGPALTFPSTMVWYLFAKGTFGFLDGGELDFGLVRDSTLNTRNDFRLMVESFEALAFLGRESIEISQAVCASGEMGARREGGPALVCPV